MIIVKSGSQMVVRLLDAVTAGKIEHMEALKTNPEAVLNFLDQAPDSLPISLPPPAERDDATSYLDDRGYR
jgi:hypothetical protein